MIIKRLSGSSSLERVILYISSRKIAERVQEEGYENIGLSDPRLVGLEMTSYTKKAQKRSTDKKHYSHYIISWKEEEAKRVPKAKELVNEFCKKMKLDKCQIYWVRHGNTKNPHIHIIVNRVNPRTSEIVKLSGEMGFEIRKINRIRQELTNKYKLIEMESGLEWENKGVSQTEYYLRRKVRESSRKEEEIEKVKRIILKHGKLEELERELKEEGWAYCQNCYTKEIALINREKKMQIKPRELGNEFELSAILRRIVTREKGKKVEKEKENLIV